MTFPLKRAKNYVISNNYQERLWTKKAVNLKSANVQVQCLGQRLWEYHPQFKTYFKTSLFFYGQFTFSKFVQPIISTRTPKEIVHKTRLLSYSGLRNLQRNLGSQQFFDELQFLQSFSIWQQTEPLFFFMKKIWLKKNVLYVILSPKSLSQTASNLASGGSYSNSKSKWTERIVLKVKLPHFLVSYADVIDWLGTPVV